MENKINFKFGDSVKYESSDDRNRIYVIIADAETPRNGQYPNEGYDYIIVPEETNKFETFINCKARELRPL